MNSKHISADEVKVGDNVWEHGIVSSIEATGGRRIFNAGAWSADAGEKVMVTN